MRGLTIARALPQHEFLFVANDDAPAVLEPEFRVARLPNIGTAFKNYKVDLAATLRRDLPILLHREKYVAEALKIIDKFKPDVCVTDLEYFVPKAAARAGLPRLTLDHQHILTLFQHNLPADMLWDAFLQGLTPRYLFKPTEFNLIISFYAPPNKRSRGVMVAPPILRDLVIDARPEDAGHILVYQSNSSDERLIDFLKTVTNREIYVFGYGNEGRVNGHIRFLPKSESEFLRLLASCAYVIQGGSHTLMSEALYLGKPVLSLPIRAMVEQRLNAHYLQTLGYGRQTTMNDLNPEFLEKFEADIPIFKKNIAAANFLGNERVFSLVDEFARSGKIAAMN